MVPLDGVADGLPEGGADGDVEVGGALVVNAGDDDSLGDTGGGDAGGAVVVATDDGCDAVAGGLVDGATVGAGLVDVVGVPFRVGEGFVGCGDATGEFGTDGVVLVMADADADAADDDWAAATWATPSWESTDGCEPETSWPTRSTAVNVTPVTSAHDMSQPMARPTGRDDHERVDDAAWPARRRPPP